MILMIRKKWVIEKSELFYNRVRDQFVILFAAEEIRSLCLFVFMLSHALFFVLSILYYNCIFSFSSVGKIEEHAICSPGSFTFLPRVS